MKIAIIGGTGKMGRWFAHFLAAEGEGVTLIGRNREKLEAAGRELGVASSTNLAEVEAADVILLSVPVDTFEEVVNKLGTHTHSGQTILDVTSVKERPVALMQRYIKQGKVLGTHPVFGPGARSLANQNVVLTPTNQAENILAEKVKSYLEARRARVRLMSPLEHDDMMAVILGLAHYIAIVSADSLLGFEKLAELEAIGGITYKVLLTLVESVLTEDPELYTSLQMNLPRLPEMQERFQQSAGSWAGLVKDGNRSEFIRRMKLLRSKLEVDNPNFGKAYDNMYRIAEGL
ncbi:MAG: prephenate dehydrogenase [Dehalococcoidales bacterium]|nr:prephenate dehydrogenase [Dehalococcoidales bacterium]